MDEKRVHSDKHINYTINDTSAHKQIYKLGKAFGSEDRIRILYALQAQPKYMIELSNELVIPLATVSRHIDVLADAKLIYVSFEPGPKGHSKLCSKAVLSAEIKLDDSEKFDAQSFDWVTEMPIGMFSDCRITPPCGMNGLTESLGDYDEPVLFYAPERAHAELLWFNTGYLSYHFPFRRDTDVPPEELSFSFEICSETIYYRNKWPSDITVKVNDTELCTFTSPGDFGGRRGLHTPEYWPVTSTQFGLLMSFTVNDAGVHVNNVLKNDKVKLEDLLLMQHPFIKLTLEIKEDAVHKGGLNLFGKNFGDYPQAIILKVK